MNVNSKKPDLCYKLFSLFEILMKYFYEINDLDSKRLFEWSDIIMETYGEYNEENVNNSEWKLE